MNPAEIKPVISRKQADRLIRWVGLWKVRREARMPSSAVYSVPLIEVEEHPNMFVTLAVCGVLLAAYSKDEYVQRVATAIKLVWHKQQEKKRKRRMFWVRVLMGEK